MANVVLVLVIVAVVYSVKPAAANVQECGASVRRSRQPRHLWSSFTASTGRIVNGKQSLQGAWPWQVSLELLHPQFGFIGHWCGGVLISSEWLLTAAHCINNDIFNLPLAALWTAVLGDWDRDMEENTEQRIPVETIILHERFHNFQHDIALMKLSRPVQLTGRSRVRAVCLPPKRLSYNQTTRCVATGWGRDAEDGALAGKLLETRIPVHDNAVCRKKYGNAVPIRSGHLCAGHLDGTTGTCVESAFSEICLRAECHTQQWVKGVMGDSGGPLQCASKDGRWYLAGITSFGSGCAKPGYPDVYTRLSYYLPWIRSKIKNL